MESLAFALENLVPKSWCQPETAIHCVLALYLAGRFIFTLPYRWMLAGRFIFTLVQTRIWSYVAGRTKLDVKVKAAIANTNRTLWKLIEWWHQQYCLRTVLDECWHQKTSHDWVRRLLTPAINHMNVDMRTCYRLS